ncbi:MAG: hypothetical protein ACK4M7_02040 [Burkholderiales bacterium]
MRFIIGNHEIYGLGELPSATQAVNGAFSYTCFYQEQYRKFLNDHFDFVYYDSESNIVYTHTMFDVGLQLNTSLKYLDFEAEIPIQGTKEELFRLINAGLKDRYLSPKTNAGQIEPVGKRLRYTFTKQGKLQESTYLMKIAKINY